MELWQVELDKLERQGGPQQTEDSWNHGTRDERSKIAGDMAKDHRSDVKQKKDFIMSVMWDLMDLRSVDMLSRLKEGVDRMVIVKEASGDAIDDMHEATAYHSMHTIVEEYQ